ncbi:acyl-CoA thioesterase II [Azorhizobium oxalatiphilum]|uniref:Acyl-CoA thioesterase 2 n=1 Tax=Azorhizobium oxalatiphilum TaxID=980631 RepID=A0A917FM88_9HYPH|nr:acyl-CoA thioesterase II [Azorhizobium oxalatiphilum]GGF89096.1 acyl-CoA thioesterase II [Azorhizobium oxalatiphilum]
MSDVDTLLAILDLEPLEINLFRGRSGSPGGGRVFGGQVVAQALVAAERTVDGDRPAHSLHGYFLLGGDPRIPIVYEVDRIRDGKSFTTRRVVAIQHGKAIFSMAVSFQVREDGISHQDVMPKVPQPEELPSDTTWREQLLARFPASASRDWMALQAIEVKPVGMTPAFLAGEATDVKPGIWLRAKEKLPDDEAVHRAILSYASDLSLLQAALVPHGRSVFDPDLQVASLDHALWFHRPFRADEWLLYVQDSPSAQASRGFCRGAIYTREGVLVASAVQEGLMRLHEG